MWLVHLGTLFAKYFYSAAFGGGRRWCGGSGLFFYGDIEFCGGRKWCGGNWLFIYGDSGFCGERRLCGGGGCFCGGTSLGREARCSNCCPQYVRVTMNIANIIHL